MKKFVWNIVGAAIDIIVIVWWGVYFAFLNREPGAFTVWAAAILSVLALMFLAREVKVITDYLIAKRQTKHEPEVKVMEIRPGSPGAQELEEMLRRALGETGPRRQSRPTRIPPQDKPKKNWLD